MPQARPEARRLPSGPVPGSLVAVASGANPRAWRGLGQVRPLPLLGPRRGAGAFCPLCPRPAGGRGRPGSGPGRASCAGVGAGWPGGLAVVILGLPGLGREEECPSEPGPSPRAGRYASPHRGLQRGYDLSKAGCEGVRSSSTQPPNPVPPCAEEPEPSVFQNWGCGEGPSIVDAETAEERFLELALKNKTQAACLTA